MNKLQRMINYSKIGDYDAVYQENGFVTLSGNISYQYNIENNGYEKYKKDFETLRIWLLNYQANHRNDEKYAITIRLGNKLLRKFTLGYKNSVRYSTWGKNI